MCYDALKHVANWFYVFNLFSKHCENKYQNKHDTLKRKISIILHFSKWAKKCPSWFEHRLGSNLHMGIFLSVGKMPFAWYLYQSLMIGKRKKRALLPNYSPFNQNSNNGLHFYALHCYLLWNRLSRTEIYFFETLLHKSDMRPPQPAPPLPPNVYTL